MKAKTLALSVLLAFSGFAFAGPDDHTPKHGGIFVEGKAADVEVVAKPELIQVYVYDHGKPAKLDGAKGKLTLLNGNQKTEAELAPAGDKLEAKGSFKVAKGTKGIALVTLAGKPAFTARFEVK
ncbi:hypothetical protein FN976_01755 [Caenimonas sedimenti]|uniref:Copper resistance protein CopC n=1 Tax=Caenimonas sedimenti TaxID=2596921 RepID=A0A562ZXD8_9BURK|nr:hypothetical protein [Caenimonas sedimenti]TWO72988.1 hypothetical protein FN976_01755 [Caenimonas sedimenti]